jgi:hypothetical protein
MTKDKALELALKALENHEGNYKLDDVGCDRHENAITAIKQALAAPVQEPVLKPLSKKWRWILHGNFADVAGFDEDGIPSFYWKESVAKFKSGELSVPCKGKNCGSLNGWLHSAECREEHEAQYTTPPAAQRQCLQVGRAAWVGLTQEEIENCYGGEIDDFAKAIEAKLKEKNA